MADETICMSMRFIKSKLLPVDIIKNFKTLLSRRPDVDYGDFETIDKAESEDSTPLAEEIITTTDNVRKEIIAEYSS